MGYLPYLDIHPGVPTPSPPPKGPGIRETYPNVNKHTPVKTLPSYLKLYTYPENALYGDVNRRTIKTP